MIYTPHKFYLGDQIKDDDGWGMWQIWRRTVCIQDFCGRPEWHGQLGRPRHRLEDIKTNHHKNRMEVNGPH